MRASVTVNLEAVRHNARKIIGELTPAGVSLAAVTKMHRADPRICAALVEVGVRVLADSRLENLETMQGLGVRRWLLRIPAPSLAAETVMFSDVSLNSDIGVLRELSKSASSLGKRHAVILMADLGDLREGFFDYGELRLAAKTVRESPSLTLEGIGVNLSCYGGVMPDGRNLGELADMAARLRRDEDVDIPVVSGGNSTSYSAFLDGLMPPGITNLRIGDTIYIGRDMIRRTDLSGYRTDAFTMKAEIAEVRVKPSHPIGAIGYAALNQKPVFEDRGMRERAILSIGRQDTDLDMICTDPGVELMGASSDHLIADVTDSAVRYRPGDVLEFTMKYTSIMRAFTSPYVDIRYQE